MNKLSTLVVSCLLLLGCLLGSTAHAAPQVGWWWNPNESGRGFFVESQNGNTFVGAYFYDADGHATWLVTGGQNADPYNYSGPLYALTNGQTLFGSYVAPTAPVNVGPMSVHFDDDTHGTFTWPGGVIAIERQIFGGSGAPFQAYSGWWWNPNEAGSGYSLELQGNNLFVVGFMYDDAGRPVWYFTAGPMSSPTTYHGDVLQFANGQTIGGPYQPPSSYTKVATVDIAFATLSDATVTFTATAAGAMAAKAGETRTDEITREFKDVAPYGFPTFYVGSFQEDVTASFTYGPASATAHHTLVGKNVTWQLNVLDAPPFVEGLHTATYILIGGEFTLTVNDQSMVSAPDLGTATCTVNATGTTPVRYPFTASSSLVVDSRDPGHYDLTFNLDQSQILISGTVQCVGPGGGILQGFDPPPLPTIQLNVQGLSGIVTPTFDDITDSIPTQTGPFFGGSYTITGSYEFFPLDECPDGNPVCLAGPERATARPTGSTDAMLRQRLGPYVAGSRSATGSRAQTPDAGR